MRYPPDFVAPAKKARVSHEAAAMIAALCPQRRTVVQAGGCAGLWPMALSAHFGHVHTFEPAPSNYECLAENVAACPNISASPCALGDRYTRAGLTRQRVHAGFWAISGDGAIDVVPVDGVMGDAVVDAIVLDVEGYEVQALTGAERVIATHHPLLWFEFRLHTAAIAAWLASHGYGTPVRAMGSDRYSQWHAQ